MAAADYQACRRVGGCQRDAVDRFISCVGVRFPSLTGRGRTILGGGEGRVTFASRFPSMSLRLATTRYEKASVVCPPCCSRISNPFLPSLATYSPLQSPQGVTKT